MWIHALRSKRGTRIAQNPISTTNSTTSELKHFIRDDNGTNWQPARIVAVFWDGERSRQQFVRTEAAVGLPPVVGRLGMALSRRRTTTDETSASTRGSATHTASFRIDSFAAEWVKTGTLLYEYSPSNGFIGPNQRAGAYGPRGKAQPWNSQWVL